MSLERGVEQSLYVVTHPLLLELMMCVHTKFIPDTRERHGVNDGCHGDSPTETCSNVLFAQALAVCRAADVPSNPGGEEQACCCR